MQLNSRIVCPPGPFNGGNQMKKTVSIALISMLGLTQITCAGMSSKVPIAMAIGCASGFGLGAIYDEVARNKDAKEKKSVQDRALGIFKNKKKTYNQGKFVGLGVGCLAGLGTGLYLDMMAEDMQQQMNARGIQLEKVDSNGNGETDELLVKMDGNISFATNDSVLQGVAKTNVENLAEGLRGYPETKIRIGGHSDGTGTLAVNQPLSQKRAESVRDALVGKGLESGRVAEVAGFANSKPLPGTNPSGNEPNNRRVEVRIVAAE